MARKLGNIIGTFEEMDIKEAHGNGRFMRVKVTLDLKEPLKRGTVITFKDKNIRVHFINIKDFPLSASYMDKWDTR